MENHAENVQQKLVPDLFTILVNNQNSHCMHNIVLKVRYFEKGLSKGLKKGNFIFFFGTQSLLIVKIMKNKRGLELVTSCYSGYETKSEKFLY